MTKTIGIIATLDTKGYEAQYIRSLIQAQGHQALLIDPGVLGRPLVQADVPRERIAQLGGKSLEELIESSKKGADRASATSVMMEGVVKAVNELWSSGRLDGLVSLGGSTGTSIGIAAMRALPVGMPKLVVCTRVPTADVGEKDITIMQTPADILGLNPIMKTTLAQAAGAIVGMVNAGVPDTEEQDQPLVAITALGVTTPATMKLQCYLDKKGFSTIVFHNKSGVLEELVRDGFIQGIIDLTPNELVKIFISKVPPGREDRLGIVRSREVPLVMCPGGLDMIIYTTPAENLSGELKGRKSSKHGPYVTLVRTNIDENVKLGKIMADKANQAIGPAAIVIPLQGFSAVDKEGQPFFDPEADRALIHQVEQNAVGQVEIVKVDAHINDDGFASALCDVFLRLFNRMRRKDA